VILLDSLVEESQPASWMPRKEVGRVEQFLSRVLILLDRERVVILGSGYVGH
jgi:hypothetical protein